MKTFLTICTCAMVTAGIYGFADMAGDVKNGTMINYEAQEEAAVFDVSTGAVATAMLNNKQLSRIANAPEEKEVKVETQESKVKVKSKKKIVKEEPVVLKEDEAPQLVVEEKLMTDVKTDSFPQFVEEKYDYREFSRGAPRKHKSKKHKKD